MFIPREYAVNVGCGTLNITEDNFLGQEDFCNKTIGKSSSYWLENSLNPLMYSEYLLTRHNSLSKNMVD